MDEAERDILMRALDELENGINQAREATVGDHCLTMEQLLQVDANYTGDIDMIKSLRDKFGEE
jgi:hypothetical protein